MSTSGICILFLVGTTFNVKFLIFRNFIQFQTGSFNNEGQVTQLIFVFHGTKTMPEHYKQRRTYFEFKLPPEKSDEKKSFK